MVLLMCRIIMSARMVHGVGPLLMYICVGMTCKVVHKTSHLPACLTQ